MRSDLDMVYSWSLGNSVCRVAALYGVNKGVASRVIARGPRALSGDCATSLGSIPSGNGWGESGGMKSAAQPLAGVVAMLLARSVFFNERRFPCCVCVFSRCQRNSGKSKRSGKDYSMSEAKCRANVWNGRAMSQDIVGIILPDGVSVEVDKDYDVEFAPCVGRFQALDFRACGFKLVAGK